MTVYDMEDTAPTVPPTRLEQSAAQVEERFNALLEAYRDLVRERMHSQAITAGAFVVAMFAAALAQQITSVTYVEFVAQIVGVYIGAWLSIAVIDRAFMSFNAIDDEASAKVTEIINRGVAWLRQRIAQWRV